MYNNFGGILKEILKEKGITSYRLSQISNISKGHIYKIIKDKNEPTLYVLNELSVALKIDLDEYYKIGRDFKSLEEYQKFVYFRMLIENNNIEELEFQVYKFDLNTVEKGLFKQLIYYARGLVMSEKYKMYNKSLEFCFLALNINKSLFNTEKLDKYVNSDVSYTILSLIEYNYFKLGRRNEAEKLASSLIRIIENIYFNLNIPRLNIPKSVFRTYISMLNNMSDILFKNKKYNEAILYCNKGIEISKKHNSYYGLKYFFELLFQSYYEIKMFDKAKIYYKKAVAICMLNGDVAYLERMNKRVSDNYPKILEGLMWELDLN